MFVIGWVMSVNPYAEQSVRIQIDRGQTVVTRGPYRIVRHPMYVGAILMYLSTPLIWGSLWALLLGALIGLMLIWRTDREDRTLQMELPGYQEFSGARLIACCPEFGESKEIFLAPRGGLQMSSATMVTPEMLIGLPGPVRRYLEFSGVVGKPIVRAVVVKQTGRIRLGPEKRWMEFKATESYSVDPPSFVWDARVGYSSIPVLTVRDSYTKGRGAIRAKLFNLFSVVDADGPRVDESSAVRFLSEVVWFPSAFLHPNFAWKAVDDNSSEVSFSAYGKIVSGALIIAPDGRLTNFISRRYKDVNDPEPLVWSTPATAYGTLCGLNLPVGGQGVWHLESGDFTYIDVRVDEIRYDPGCDCQTEPRSGSFKP
jgi:hypothetical protein